MNAPRSTASLAICDMAPTRLAAASVFRQAMRDGEGSLAMRVYVRLLGELNGTATGEGAGRDGRA